MTEKYQVNINDSNGDPVFVGDVFEAHMIRPSFVKPTLVTVVKDISEENTSFDRDYDVEDADGNRLWNAYMVIKNGTKVC